MKKVLLVLAVSAVFVACDSKKKEEEKPVVPVTPVEVIDTNKPKVVVVDTNKPKVVVVDTNKPKKGN